MSRDSDDEMQDDQIDIEREEKKRSKRDRSRSRSRDRSDRKKHKKPKKEKKRHSERRNRESGEDTGNEGGDTPEREREGERRERKSYRGEYDREKENGRQNEHDRDKDRRDRKEERRDRRDDKNDGKHKEEAEAEPGELGKGNVVLSLSVEETNKLRAKLGLKPLNITQKDEEDDKSDQPGVLIPGDRNKTRHLAPEHWGQRDQAKKLREKLEVNRSKRKLNTKLQVIKGLGESDSDDDDASKWIERQKKKTKEKEEAEKRAKAMEQLDEEFGVGDIVDEGLKSKRQQEYSGRNLKGLRVEHSSEAFNARETVLTLKDQDILDDGYEDVLVNVNIIDDERTKKSLENIKAGKEGYQAYGTEEVDEMTGETKKKELLYQYNEEIDGVKKDSFTLEGGGEFNEAESKERELAKIRQKLKLHNTVSLHTSEQRIASDYYTEQEMATFKKPKKKKKIKKKILKADDLLAMIDGDTNETDEAISEKQKKRGSRIIDDDVSLPDGRLPSQDNDNFTIENESDTRSITALRIANKLKKFKSVDSVAEEILKSNQETPDVEMEDEEDNKNDLVIDQTKEFCRGLTEVSYSKSGYVQTVDQELLDFEENLESKRLLERSKLEDEVEKQEIADKAKKSKRGTWEEVDHEIVESGKWKEGTRGKPKKKDKQGGGGSSNDNNGKASYRPSILDDESMASTSMGAALKLAGQKGYLDLEEKQHRSTGLVHLRCQNYNIEDKSRDHEEDDRKRRRGGGDRGYSGPTQTFSEKKGYKPSVNIEYIDDSGRSMSSKEAFRYLSHKFHGKGSGKLKTEKRHRKIMEEKLMEKMSSTDTPLNTLTKLQHKTKEMATPYIVLSGNKTVEHTNLKK